MPGSADLNNPPSDIHRDAAFTSLARFHRILSQSPDRKVAFSPGIVRRLQEIDSLIDHGFGEIGNQLNSRKARFLATPIADEEEIRHLSTNWLALARDLAPRLAVRLREASLTAVPLQPCLRDARPEHFLFVEGRSELGGLIDFGAMDIDCVSSDLARLLGDWLDPVRDADHRSKAIASYERLRPLTAQEAGLMPVFEASTLVLGPGRWVRWLLIENRTFSNPKAARERLTRSVRRLQMRSDWVRSAE
jgi:Ser/Thr protein kinase RdoA (MazF antagonist)